MDIVVGLSQQHYNSLLIDCRDYSPAVGYHYFIITKKPRKSGVGDRLYLYFDKQIVGYSIILGIKPIDDDVQTNFRGAMWEYKNAYLVIWKKTEWYIEGILHDMYLKSHCYKYINLKKVLKNQKEPKLADMREIWKAHQLELKGKQLTSKITPIETVPSVTDEDTQEPLLMAVRSHVPALEEIIKLGGNIG